MEHPIVAPTRDNRHYYLRGLLRCGPCGELLVPAFSSSGRRLYGCPRPGCPRPWVPACETEERVWTRFQSLNQRAARDVPPAQRQGALIAVLNRVVVGIPVDDLEYEWRD